MGHKLGGTEVGGSPLGWSFAKRYAKPFKINGSYNTRAELLGCPDVVPNILVSSLALHKIFYLVSFIEMEVGWLGVAKRIGENILVEDVFLFDQEVGYGHTELTTESMSSIMQEILEKPGGEDLFNNIRFWGHSHGNGGTFPSGQDDKTMNTFGDFGADFFLRGIFNRNGDMNFSLYDWGKNIAFHGLPWKPEGELIGNDERIQIHHELREEMRVKVRHIIPKFKPIRFVTPTSWLTHLEGVSSITEKEKK